MRRLSAWRSQHRTTRAAAQARREPQPDGTSGEPAGGSSGKAAGGDSPRNRCRRSLPRKDSEEQVAAARLWLAAYLQQQGGISQAQAASLAGEVCSKLGAAADQLVPAPLQWFVGRGMQPLKAAQLVARMCKGNASVVRHWPAWQPAVGANWQLADSYLAAYRQQCMATEQALAKGSEAMAALLSGQPSRYRLLLVPDLPSRAELLQQGQLGLTASDVGRLIASGLMLTGTLATMAATTQWLVSFAGSTQAAAGMVRVAAPILNCSAATLEGRVDAMQAAWAGTLQPDQVQQLLCRMSAVLAYCPPRNYGATAAVLRDWFPQPHDLFEVLQHAPQLLGAPAATLQANEHYLAGPPLGLSRQQFLARVVAAPQPFFMDLSKPRVQLKLAFLTQVGGVPLERALSADHLNYLKFSTAVLAGRYFLLTEHGVEVPRHEDGGIVLGYVTRGKQGLLRLMRRHVSAGRLPADDGQALAYVRQWLAAWPETESGRRWAKPPGGNA